MTNDLVVFLNARLDEDAELARHCDEVGCCGEWTARGDTVGFCQMDLPGFHPAIAQHVALHDPARVLREVEAKRSVLSRHTLSPAEGDPERPWDDRDDCQFDGDLWPCDDLLDLAHPYQDHPDFPRQYKPNRAAESHGDRTPSAPERAKNSGEPW
ncbi:DUF6221 family protein [Streptomyces sp. NPDC002787]